MNQNHPVFIRVVFLLFLCIIPHGLIQAKENGPQNVKVTPQYLKKINKGILYSGLTQKGNVPYGYGKLLVYDLRMDSIYDILIGVFDGELVRSAQLYMGNYCSFYGELRYQIMQEDKSIFLKYTLEQGFLTDKDNHIMYSVSPDKPLIFKRIVQPGNFFRLGTTDLSGKGFVMGYLDPLEYSGFSLLPSYRGATPYNTGLLTLLNDKGLTIKPVDDDRLMHIVDMGEKGNLFYDVNDRSQPYRGCIMFDSGHYFEIDHGFYTFVDTKKRAPITINAWDFPFISDHFTQSWHLEDHLYSICALKEAPDFPWGVEVYNKNLWDAALLPVSWPTSLPEMKNCVQQTKKGYTLRTWDDYYRGYRVTTNQTELVPLKSGYYTFDSGGSIKGNSAFFSTPGQSYSDPFENCISSPSRAINVKINKDRLILTQTSTIQIADYYDQVMSEPNHGIGGIGGSKAARPKKIAPPSFPSDLCFQPAKGTDCPLKDGVTYKLPIMYLGVQVNSSVSCKTKMWATPRVRLYQVGKGYISGTGGWNGNTYMADPYPPYRAVRTITYSVDLNELMKKLGLDKVAFADMLYRKGANDFFWSTVPESFRRKWGAAIYKSLLSNEVSALNQRAKRLQSQKSTIPQAIELFCTLGSNDDVTAACQALFSQAQSIQELFHSFVTVYPIICSEDFAFSDKTAPLYFLNGLSSSNPLLLNKSDGSGEPFFKAFINKRTELMNKESEPLSEDVYFIRAFQNAQRKETDNMLASYFQHPTYSGGFSIIDQDGLELSIRTDAENSLRYCLDLYYNRLQGLILNDWGRCDFEMMGENLNLLEAVHYVINQYRRNEVLGFTVDVDFLQSARLALQFADNCLADLQVKNTIPQDFSLESPFWPMLQVLSYPKSRSLVVDEKDRRSFPTEDDTILAIRRFFDL